MIDTEAGRSRTGVRKFSFAFRIEFLRQWDQCVERGAKTRLLREHNLARNTVERWLVARDRGEFTTSMVAAAEKSRDRVDSRDRAELARLRKENAALKEKVAQSEAAQQILGKAFELLEGITESSTQTQDQIPPALMSADEYAKWLQRNKLS
jgi:transposase-like protein